MTNNEILNKIHKNGYVGSVPVEQSKTWEGKAFTYHTNLSLTPGTPAYLGFKTGAKEIHLKDLFIASKDDDVTVEISEEATYTGGTEVSATPRNRKTAIYDYRDEFATMAYNTPTALKNQPFLGEPTVRRVMNNGNTLHADVAVVIDNPFDEYGIKVNPVRQVDKEQGLQITYKSKQVRVANKQDIIDSYTLDIPVALAHQDYEGDEPVISAVYNNTVLLEEDVDYTITQNEGTNEWEITLLETSELIDDTKNIIVAYQIEEEYVADFAQSEDAFDFTYATLAIDTPSGTFEEDEEIEGGTSGAKGILVSIEAGVMILSGVEGKFVDQEEVEGRTSNAKADLTADGVAWHFVAFEKQSYDDSAITVATVANGTRNNIVEYLSFTQDYTFAFDSTYKITLKDTVKTDSNKPVIVLYTIEDLFSKDSGVIIHTAPTVATQGDVIEKYVLPVANDFKDDWELILRADTKHLFKVVSTKTQTVSLGSRWYLE